MGERSRNSDLGGERSWNSDLGASSSLVSVVMSLHHLRPGIHEPTLPINESARSIIDSNLPRTKSSLRNLVAFKESGDEAVTSGDKLGGMEFACFPD